jgi:O-antigen ligase
MRTKALSDSKTDLIFAVLAGTLFGVALLKFGNPTIFDRMIAAPTEALEWLIQPWPLSYGYTIFGCMLAVGIVNARRQTGKTPGFFWFPLLWLGWQGLATFESRDHSQSIPTLWHFIVCALLFYIGWHNPMRNRSFLVFLTVICVFFIAVVRIGFDQHFGGLAETSRRFFLYIYPQMEHPAPELIKKMKTTRIFSTLFYPNTLAAAVLFYLPMFVGVLLRIRGLLRPSIFIGFSLLLIGPACACLVWSGSKAGWLVLLLLVIIAVFRLEITFRSKALVLAFLCLAGVGGFFIKYKSFFDRGATSACARLEYWKAAVKIGASHPVFGTGPATFGEFYKLIKPPDAEPARLAHNDYLEQWSDSGFIGFMAYFGFILCSLTCLYRESIKSSRKEDFWVWLGLLGLAVHSLFEFHLYIPALAWPFFFLIGRQSSILLNDNREVISD